MSSSLSLKLRVIFVDQFLFSLFPPKLLTLITEIVYLISPTFTFDSGG